MSRRTAAWTNPRRSGARTSATGAAKAAASQGLRRAAWDLEDAIAALDTPVAGKRPEIAELRADIDKARRLLLDLQQRAEE